MLATIRGKWHELRDVIVLGINFSLLFIAYFTLQVREQSRRVLSLAELSNLRQWKCWLLQFSNCIFHSCRSGTHCARHRESLSTKVRVVIVALRMHLSTYLIIVLIGLPSS